jgi:hypothetical protein
MTFQVQAPPTPNRRPNVPLRGLAGKRAFTSERAASPLEFLASVLARPRASSPPSRLYKPEVTGSIPERPIQTLRILENHVT